MPAEKGRNAALTQEPDPDNAGVGTPQKAVSYTHLTLPTTPYV